MSKVLRAREVARDLLAEPLPQRWRHVQAVGAKAVAVGVVLPPVERPILEAAAWLHDVGYSPALAFTGLHALDGARWLRTHGFDGQIATLVANHSCALREAEERGLAEVLRDEFPHEESLLADALWFADMTTGPDGQDMTVSERLGEVRSRYGPQHLVTRFWKNAEPELIAAASRIEKRLRS